MKKVFLCFLVIGVVAGLAVAPAWSQDKKVGFSLNAGVQTNVWDGSSFDQAVFTLDGRVGFALGKSFEISPEFMAVFNYGSYFEASGATLLYPGVMLHFKSGSFFVGLGAVLPWLFYDGGSDSGDISPKIDIGYKFGKLQVTAYLITWTEAGIDFLDVNWVGLTLGYRF
jgi:hypothetical protein